MKQLIYPICILFSQSLFAHGIAMYIGQMNCNRMKTGSLVSSKLASEIIRYSDEASLDNSKKTIYEFAQRDNFKYQNIISMPKSANQEIYTAQPINNRKQMSFVVLGSASIKTDAVNPKKDTDSKYNGVDVKETNYVSNYYSVWPASISCVYDIFNKIWKHKKELSANEFGKYNLHKVRHKNRQGLFFLPPDYLLTLDVKNNLCGSKICDVKKKMKILKVERVTEMLIDDNMNIYHLDLWSNFDPDIDYERYLKKPLPR